jgi:CRISPR-associated endonuclease/helicase Cas3
MNDMPESYPEFFFRVTENPLLPYQQRYGCNPFSLTLLIIPTGLGKTDAVLMPWLYARATHDPSAPTRLILVLPRQNLTAQTAKNARKRVETAGLSREIRVLELMAGSEDNDETLRPDEPTIIVSTQDLYFSRALNRGYARRPPRWPIDFALYNQDCLIVLDEIQLMDEALATSTQLAAFRKRFGVFGNACCVWMSATVKPAWLKTVDFQSLPPEIRLNDDDFAQPIVSQRLHAPKSLALAPEECHTPAGCAEFALSRHKPRTRTLILANTVPRAREVFTAIRREFHNAILLHSRFRPHDRKSSTDALLAPIAPEGQIVVATQVLEAGIDITARLLITDLAPWGSLVQRFGRVNRYGDDTDAEIWWVDRPTHSRQKDPTAPYSPEQIQQAWERLQTLTSAAPADLPEEDGTEPFQHTLRCADLLDLFDTTPDLSGNELDVSRFIRATEDKDVYLAWRDWDGDAEHPKDRLALGDDELCPVPIGEFREFIAKKHRVFTLNFATEKWTEIIRDTPLYPGMLAVTRSRVGGYTPLEGWSPDSKTPVIAVPTDPSKEAETDTSDPRSFQKYRQTLRAHTDRVLVKLDAILARHDLDERWTTALRTAAVKHDWGKAHEVFQATLHKNDRTTELLAKQCGNEKHSRKHFRHELASALAMLQTGDSDLAAYLAAAHHGRIRLGIRSMPGEREENKVAVARGIRHGDELPACELATGIHVPAVTLSLALMEFGAETGSWTDRTLRIRDELGPFRLAYLEMLLRTADEAASADQGTDFITCPQ